MFHFTTPGRYRSLYCSDCQIKVNIKVIAIQRDPHLSPDEGKSPAQFEHEFLKVIEDRRFQVAFQIIPVFAQAQKFQNKRVFDEIERLLWFSFVARPFEHRAFVFRERDSFKRERVDLAFKLSR